MQFKHIPMDGPQNFRDLGGFLTQDGKAVAWNRLFRADSLSALSEKDILTFRRLNIRTIVDLRGRSEQKAMPDKVPEGIAYYSCPMMQEDISTPEEAAGYSFAQSLKTGYLEMIEKSPANVGAAAKAVMEGLNNGAVVFHCTAGKDRTGVLAAILLLRLGVREEDIIADYQVSYTYNANGINRIVQNIPQLKTYLEQAGEDSVLHSHPKNIQAVLGLLNTDTVGAWLEHAGVSAGLQQSFCDHMLEPAE
ncbi:tyrosine-protein phosphatase [Butyricicoccus sp.]|uniref:tyrosine-protein phosphatase n=1 Tax=Butyricicoccus sp. TaxID=2049021 RepID=UPI003736A060